MTRQKKPRTDHEQEITNAVIAHVESYLEAEANGEEQEKWESPFGKFFREGHYCAATDKEYKGWTNNFFLTLMAHAAGFSSDAWGTYKQWTTLGTEDAPVNVKKGQKGSAWIAFPYINKDKVTGDDVITGFGYKPVFNADQIEGWTPEATELPENQVARCEEAETYIANLGIDMREGGNRAFYSPATDYYQMPPMAAFKATKYSTETEGYYGTKFHEVGHATGHDSRCKRELQTADRTAYAFEELVAELTATIMTVRFGISAQPREDHSKYIRSWLKALKDDKTFIIKAMKQASKAIAWMDSKQPATAN